MLRWEDRDDLRPCHLQSFIYCLQEQLEAARLEVVEARQRGSAREHELNTELRLLEVRSEAELRSMKERLEGLLSQQAKAEAQRVEHIAAHDAALSTAQRETEVAQEEGRRMQMELRRCVNTWSGCAHGKFG